MRGFPWDGYFSGQSARLTVRVSLMKTGPNADCLPMKGLIFTLAFIVKSSQGSNRFKNTCFIVMLPGSEVVHSMLCHFNFHYLNSFFTFFGNAHYFRKNANLFSCVEKHNFCYLRVEAAYHSKAFIHKL